MFVKKLTLAILLVLATTVPAHALSLTFRGAFSPFGPEVKTATVTSTNPTTGQSTTVVADAITAGANCTSDPTKKCVDWTMTLARSDTREFKLCIGSALPGEVVCSTPVTFQVPAQLQPPNFTVNVVSFQ